MCFKVLFLKNPSNNILKRLIITNLCDYKINHNTLHYNDFSKLMELKQFYYIDFNIKKNQKQLIKYIYNNNVNIDNIDIKKKYFDYTHVPLKLNNNEISKIKLKLFGKFNELSLLEAIKKINISDIVIDLKSKDVNYMLKINNKIYEREETIIIFGNKNNLNLMNKNKNFIEFFLDATYKIIPKKYKGYKLLTIASTNNCDTTLL